MNAYKAHADELVRVDEVSDLVERLADPCITLALTAALMGRPLDYTDLTVLTELRTLCKQTQNAVDSYVEEMRRDAANAPASIAPVDVLAAIDYAVLALHSTSAAPERIALVHASAAVAELIEAARDFKDCESSTSWSELTWERRRELMERYQPPAGARPLTAARAALRAALARIGGAA